MFAASVKEVNMSVPASKNAARKHPQLCLPAIRSASRTPNAKETTQSKTATQPSVWSCSQLVSEKITCPCLYRRSSRLRMLLRHVLRATRANPMPPEPAQCRKCHACHAECRSMSPSATPATQSARPYRQVPRCHKRHACHANWRSMSPGANPATPCRHVCHAECTSMSPSATPATQSARPCQQVRLPRKVKVDVAKCHACHANSRGMPRRQRGQLECATRASPVP